MVGRRLAAVFLITALALAAGPRGAEGAKPDGEPVPVILVHGVTSGGPAVWGARAPGTNGLYGRLLGRGYSTGRTLFAYDYAGAAAADYVTLAGVGLDRVVRQALAGGFDQVDIVTFGSGALVARYWAATHPDGQAPLRNLIMIAPPNHGQFQADVLKVLYHTARLVGGRGTPGSGGEEFPKPPAFANEDQFVADRAQDYRCLYSEYLFNCRLLGEFEEDAEGDKGSAAGSGPVEPPDYDTWLLTEKAGLIQGCVFSASAQEPPNPPGLGLTRAYYEILSLRVGRQLYLASAVAAGKAPSLPKLEDLVSEEWRAKIEVYLRGLLFDWGVPKAKQLWALSRAGAGMSLGQMLTCLAPGGAATSRLVPEYLAFPRPGGAPCLVDAQQRLVLCNAFLHNWQEEEALARAAGSRYATIAGACPSPLGLVIPGVGPNDLSTEAASALTDPCPPDGFCLETGFLWAHGLVSLGGKSAADVLTILSGRTQGGSDSLTGSASLWGPSYRQVVPIVGAKNGSLIKVEVKMGDPGVSGLDGLRAVAWLGDLGPGSGDAPSVIGRFLLGPDPAGADGAILRGQLAAPRPDPGRRLVLGVRLAPDGSAGPGYLTMGRYLRQDVSVPFAYSVSETTEAEEATSGGTQVSPPQAPEDETDGPGDGAASPGSGVAGPADGTASPEDGAASTPGEESETGTGSPSDSDAGSQSPGPAEIIPTIEPPLVNVVRVTRLTTDKREDRTFHARWEWDFGDGEHLSDPDPSHTKVTVEHLYAAAGPYRVTAKSFSTDGRVLRDLAWTVQAGDSIVTFEAETIVEPEVTLTLAGPRKWVTGKPARFTLEAEVGWPPRTRRQVIRAYPGWAFGVMWERPGTFEVRAAINVRQSYEFPDQRLTVSNTYVTVVALEVFTPGLTE